METPPSVARRSVVQHAGKSSNLSLEGEGSRTAEKLVSQGPIASSGPAFPGHLDRRTVKHTAKRTPRNRLIASLKQASSHNGAAKAVQPSTTLSAEAPGTVSLATFTRNSTIASAKGIIAEASAGLKAQPPATGPRAPPLSPSAAHDAGPLVPDQDPPHVPDQDPPHVTNQDPPHVPNQNPPHVPNQDPPHVPRTAEISRVTNGKSGLFKAKAFDSAAFDAAIYQQPAAMNPPPGVSIAVRRQGGTPSASSEERRRYIYANPAIHLTHNRSEDWHKKKAQEIQARGGRKAWFGKVIQRQRWLRAQQEEQSVVDEAGPSQRRTTPRPWTYSRPLDFGDVPESQLPEDVLRNPGWLEACAWHRETQQIRALRQRQIFKSEQETKQFYNHVLAGMRPVSGR